MIRPTAIRRSASFTATTTATAICRLRVPRPASAGRESEAVEHRRQRRRGGGDRADRRTNPGALAARAHSAARRLALRTGRPARRFKDFRYRTLESWSRRRRVSGNAEWTNGEANPSFVVTSLTRGETQARILYEDVHCARGEMENRIKECQCDLFADRTSATTMRANQLRALARLARLPPAVRGQAHRARAHAVRRGDLWHDPIEGS